MTVILSNFEVDNFDLANTDSHLDVNNQIKSGLF